MIVGIGDYFCSLYDNMWDDGNSLDPKEVHSYLTRVMYNRRNKFNPLWNSLILGGVKNGQKYLGMVNLNCSFYLSQNCKQFAFKDINQSVICDSYPGQHDRRKF